MREPTTVIATNAYVACCGAPLTPDPHTFVGNVVPLSVDLNTPTPLTPIHTVDVELGSMSMSVIARLEAPATGTRLKLVPPSIERYRPFPVATRSAPSLVMAILLIPTPFRIVLPDV